MTLAAGQHVIGTSSASLTWHRPRRPAAGDFSKLLSKGVIPVIEGYLAEGWDVDSANDIVWESVEGRCPEYLEAVKRAVRSYGDPS